MIEFGFILGCIVSLIIIGDTLYNMFQGYKQWLNDEKIDIHPFFDPFLNSRWGQNFGDYMFSLFVRTILVLTAPLFLSLLWLPAVIIVGIIGGGKYHKYVVQLKKKANQNV